MLNKAQLIGHLGRDPEMRQTSEGSAVANLAVATNETWKDGQDRFTTEVVGERLRMLGGRGDRNQGAASQATTEKAPAFDDSWFDIVGPF